MPCLLNPNAPSPYPGQRHVPSLSALTSVALIRQRLVNFLIHARTELEPSGHNLHPSPHPTTHLSASPLPYCPTLLPHESSPLSHTLLQPPTAPAYCHRLHLTMPISASSDHRLDGKPELTMITNGDEAELGAPVPLNTEKVGTARDQRDMARLGKKQELNVRIRFLLDGVL